ncbi:MAG: UTP--glucose-1-phosphate uridylyltransferase GalU [Verrucomicrobiae bacterium]|nr:UTP--glucose-1-phosphate uridylyltransferase GalU [Verrucomicrobiae bacterium]MCP5538620.1 UTP--glucose-1-phosphate uridylyltransferase GalU [Akkermansiaceae bacterium]MCP5550917.1 UTP--glucose-1-phosphate uridylyltransferase GalU [Akkermansiaceae bacterium]
MKVRKAIIPAAGFGTRFLPATKSQPKEMLPIVDTPTIQYVVEECVGSGITDILMVIGKSKRAIEEHFYRNYELEDELKAKGKTELLAEIEAISNLANLHFVWQKELNGLGDAVRYGRSFAGNEPFALLLGDTLLGTNDELGRPVTRQLIEICERYGESVVALEQVDPAKVGRYGIGGGAEIEDGLFKLDALVEKPRPEEAPSNLAIAGRYVFVPEIFDFLAETKPGKNDEIQLTDAMARMMEARGMYGLRFEGKRYDIGNKLDFLKTNIEFGLRREDIGPGLRRFIKEIAADL